MPDEALPNAPAPAPANPAVAHCLHAFRTVYKTELTRGELDFRALQRAGSAFRNAMPPLDDHHNIRNFIACVAQGILLGAVDVRQSSKLLYAAQVALSAIRAQSAPASRKEPAAS
ncbi:MAG TPA: hypothetical protein VMV57_05800 [Terracidiphilus sp.]|nr:hypothetical protein [Terracidiphilus sp.]